MEKFAIGLILGALGGALLVTNNYKMRTLVKKSQEEVQAKLDELMDEKIRAMEESAEETVDSVKETVKENVDKLKSKVQKEAKQ
ncbi:MAG: hypothetical protein IJX91_02620 [Clostridia bacterium]|nr:hypothetical protein [Clostridia bacterium]